MRSAEDILKGRTIILYRERYVPFRTAVQSMEEYRYQDVDNPAAMSTDQKAVMKKDISLSRAVGLLSGLMLGMDTLQEFNVQGAVDCIKEAKDIIEKHIETQ